MAISQAIKTLWSAKIQRQLETITSLKDHCDFTFGGEIKRGKELKIIGVVRPTIRTYVPGTPITRDSGTDTSMLLKIDQMEYFNIGIESVDKVQSTEGLFEAITAEGVAGLAEKADQYVASIIEAEKGSIKQVKLDVSAATDGGISVLESAFSELYKNNVKPNAKLWLEITPDWYTVLRPAIQDKDTNNSAMIKSGAVGSYSNAWITIENNLTQNTTIASQAGCVANILRTEKAVAFAGQLDSLKPYEPEDGFEEAVKALYVFGAKVVRPQEICLIGTY